MQIKLEDYQLARLQDVAEDRGLTVDEAARMILVSGINLRYRELQREQCLVAYAERLARGWADE